MNGIRRSLAPVLLAAAALALAYAVQRPLACPVEIPPQTLRTLYKVSERVVVARVGAREVLSTEEEAASVRIALHVTETLKGAPAELVHFYRDEYVTGGDEVKGGEEAQVVSISGRAAPRLKRGERYLFFLEPREEGGGYVIDDEGYGIKKLSDEDLKVYLERLKELAELTRQGPEDKLALVEWLVRCAEQPATRWEGAYELLQSAEAVAGGDTGEEAPPEAAAKAPAAEVAGQALAAAGGGPSEEAAVTGKFLLLVSLRYARPDPALAPLLDAVQKQRLADALFATPDPKPGDDELAQVVADFGDPRFAPFALGRLRRFEDEAPPEVMLWLRALATSLKSEEVGELADSYSQEATYYEGEEEEESGTRTDSAGSAATGGATEGGEGESEAADAEGTVVPEVDVAAVKRATVKRSALLKSLLARIDLLVSTGQLASN